MKKIIFLLSIGILLTSCGKNESILDKKIICSKQAENYLKGNKFKISMEDNFYSPIIDTCLIVIKRGNGRSESIIDSINQDIIGEINYDENIGFEGWNVLPKICNKDYGKNSKIYLPGFSIAAGGGGKMDKVSATRTYKMEKIYRNCLDYLKGKDSNYEFAELGFEPTGDEPPIFWAD